MALGLDAGILLMVSLIAIIALIAFVNGILIPNSQSWFKDSLIKMPRFTTDNSNNENYNTYNNLRVIAIYIIIIALTFSAIVLVLEEFYIFRREQAFTIIAHGTLYLILLLLFPSLWDMLANTIESISYYILNPENPNDTNAIDNKIEYIFQYIGGITAPNIDWNTVLQFLTNPNDAAQTIFRDVFLAVFKAIIASIITFLMFVIGIIRIVLTSIMMISLPLILAISLFPFADRVMQRFKDILIGLTFAPILSSLVITSGVALLNSIEFSPLQQWLASIAIGFLAISIPTITAPIIGSMVTQLTTIATGGALGALYMSTQTVTNVAKGAISTYKALSEAGIYSSLPLSRRALALSSGAIKGLSSGLSSGLLMQAGEALKSTGFSKLSEPIYLARDKIMRYSSSNLRDYANNLISNYQGSAIEGALLFSIKEADISNTNLEEANRFMDRIKRYTNKQNYNAIADEFNDYLQLKHMPNKEALGKSLSSLALAFSNNINSIKAFYAGLNNLRNEPLQSIIESNSNRINDYIYASNYIRRALEHQYGITIPEELHKFDINSKPNNAIVTQAYETKYKIGTLLLNIENRIAKGDIPDIELIELEGIKEKVANMINNSAKHLPDENKKRIIRGITDHIKRIYGEVGMKILYDELKKDIPIIVNDKTIDLSDKIAEDDVFLGKKQEIPNIDYLYPDI